MCQAKGIEFCILPPESSPPPIMVDCGRLKQVLTNIVGNAVKFTPRGGIYIRAAHQGEKLTVLVEDTGIGISEARQKAVFESFTQADVSTSRQYGGTGLGLTICKNLINMMGGQMGLRSTLGAGSTFWFEVPAPVCEPVPTGEVSPASEATALKLQGHVLVAEDNEVNVIVVEKLLEQFGLSCEVAGDGIEVVRMFEKGRYDLVLMDLHMPHVDGLEATRKIRELGEAGANIPIIAMTAAALAEDRDACISAGMNDYLTKPFRAEEMRNLLARFVRALP
jgi:CheY-like chemotaxis protein